MSWRKIGPHCGYVLYMKCVAFYPDQCAIGLGRSYSGLYAIKFNLIIHACKSRRVHCIKRGVCCIIHTHSPNDSDTCKVTSVIVK